MSLPVNDYDSALAFLYGRINYERTLSVPYRTSAFNLERFRDFLNSLGNPQQQLPAVHITGTKGKGSTAHLVAAILAAAGLNTALYTSPHLERLEERFVIAGEPIATNEFVRWMAHLQPLVEDSDRAAEARGDRALTFFEVTTALAFLAFVDHRVDIAVLEVGLGGRLDSTNLCRPLVCGITSISFDHMKQLGNTLAAIAREKAGIIKPGVPVVSGVMDGEPRDVIREMSVTAGAKLWQRGEDFDFRFHAAGSNGESIAPGLIDYREGECEWRDLSLAMLGAHQGANAATAVALVRRLAEQGWPVTEAAIRAGLQNGKCPARVEWIPGSPPIVLDTAHNPASITALLDSLPPRTDAKTPRVLIFAASQDKDVRAMLTLLLPQFDVVVLTKYVHNPRSTEPSELKSLAEQISAANGSERSELVTVDDPLAALIQAKNWPSPPALIVITGSFFLAAELGAAARSGNRFSSRETVSLGQLN